MPQPAPSIWLRLCPIGLGIALTVAAGRLAWIQVLHPARPDKPGESTERATLRYGPRGRILDRSGTPLAMSQTLYSLRADPAILADVAPQFAEEAARLLEMSAGDLRQLLDLTNHITWKLVKSTNDLGTETSQWISSTNRVVSIRKGVLPQDWERIQQGLRGILKDEEAQRTMALRNSLPRRRFVREKARLAARFQQIRIFGIVGEAEERRIYPHESLAAHVVGFVTNAVEQGQNPTHRLGGMLGIERHFDEALRGRSGLLQTHVVRQRELAALRETDLAGLAGMNIVLNLDLTIQTLAEQAVAAGLERLRAKAIAAVVTRPKTGEILALVSAPAFTPGRIETNAQFINYTTQVKYEPGSVFKIFTYAAVLQENQARMDEMIHGENGYWRAYRIRDDHPKPGSFNLEEAFGMSMNTVAAKLGLRLAATNFVGLVRQFGFGTPTGIPLGWEQNGVVKNPAKRAGRVLTLDSWDGFTQSRMSYGYSIDVTPMQIAMALGAIANGGDLMEPLLVKRIEHPDGTILREFPPRKRKAGVVRPEVARQVTHLMEYAVAHGTGSKARLDEWTVAGKTGTSRRAATGQKGYSEQYFGSFAGFLPSEDPQLGITIVVYEPTTEAKQYYGGSSAAPIFAEIARGAASYLGVRPSPRAATNQVTAQIATLPSQVALMSPDRSHRP